MTSVARAVLLAVALVPSAGCSGCRREPALRLTYEVDVAHAYGGARDVAQVMETARSVVARRLDALAARATVAVRGPELVVELAALAPEDLGVVKTVVARSGRLELKIADDGASDAFFGALGESVYPPDEAVAPARESIPDGLDASGRKKSGTSSFARVTCKPPKHAAETTTECLARLRSWAATLAVPPDHELGFEAVTEPVPGTDPVQLERVGWRTLYLLAPVELSGETLVDVRAAREADLGQYHVNLAFGPAGAARLEELTAAHVNRRMAILVDGVVVSAPVIAAKIAGGHAQITMGAGDPEKQLRDAQEIEMELASGSLPAPMHLSREETLGPRR